MAEAYRSGAYSMQTIAEYFGVSRMTVSRAVKRDEKAAVTCEICPPFWTRFGPPVWAGAANRAAGAAPRSRHLHDAGAQRLARARHGNHRP
jgi:hypothetical protein